MRHEDDDVRVLILSGGKGTRSANPSIPKLLQELKTSVTLLENQLEFIQRAGFTRVSLLVNYEMGQIEERLQKSAHLFPGLDIQVLPDQSQSGTTAAVAHAVEKSDENKFFLLLGDLAVNGDMSVPYAKWRESGKSCSVMVHPNNHPEDSDCVFVTVDQSPIRVKRKTTNQKFKDLIALPMGGMIFFEKNVMELVDQKNLDVSSALVEAALGQDKLHVFNLSTYFKDSGTPTRLERIREDIENGAFAARGADLRAAIFLDRDGTLVPDTGTSRSEVSPTEIEQATAAQIRRANRLGIPIFLVSNQPGIAKGQISFSDLANSYNQLEEALRSQDALLDDFRFCPHHPEVGFPGEVIEFKTSCLCRKPGAGMLTDLASHHGIDLSKSFLIGDTENDEGAARNSGARFVQVIYGGLQKESVGGAIRTAIDFIQGEQ